MLSVRYGTFSQSGSNCLGRLGHVLTLNAAALACAQSDVQPGESWSVPTGSLERLLELLGRMEMKLGKLRRFKRGSVREHPNLAALTLEASRISRSTMQGSEVPRVSALSRFWGLGPFSYLYRGANNTKQVWSCYGREGIWCAARSLYYIIRINTMYTILAC